MLDPRERHRFSLRTPGHAVPTRAYQPRHNASTPAAALSPPKHEARSRGPPSRAGLTNLTPYQLPGYGWEKSALSGRRYIALASLIADLRPVRSHVRCPLLASYAGFHFVSGPGPRRPSEQTALA